MSYIKRIIKEEFSRNEYQRVIKQLLRKYVGGRPFFDALDEYIKTHDDMMLALVRGMENKHIVTSGSFGDNLYELYEKGLFDCKSITVFNGKICTKRKGVTCWYPADVDLEGKQFVFVDDSTFSGRTIKVIDNYLRKHHNSKIVEVSVAYDGSKTKNSKVHSLYRYYDHHPINESNDFDWIQEIPDYLSCETITDGMKIYVENGYVDDIDISDQYGTIVAGEYGRMFNEFGEFLISFDERFHWDLHDGSRNHLCKNDTCWFINCGYLDSEIGDKNGFARIRPV